jgi:hypothetical protein
MLLRFLLVHAIIGSCWQLAAGDLTAARNEKNPEKSYWLALENGSQAIAEARKHLQEMRLEPLTKSLEEAVESVRFANDKLYSTGKSPSKNSKHFKRAELKMRDMVRKLDALVQEAGVDDRPPIEQARKTIQQIHDDLLLDIMGRRKQ